MLLSIELLLPEVDGEDWSNIWSVTGQKLGQINSPLPLAEVFVTLDWSNIWSVTGQTLGRMDSPLPLAEVFVTLDWSSIWSVTG